MKYTNYEKFVLSVFALTLIVSHMDRQILAILVEPIKSDLGIGDFGIGLLQGPAFAIFYSLAAVPIARITDQYNRRNVVAVGLGAWSLFAAGCSLATTFAGLFFMRSCVAIGEASLTPAVSSIYSDQFPAEKRPGAYSVFIMGAPIGAGLSMIFAGALYDHIAAGAMFPMINLLRPWQQTFVIVALPGFLILLLVLMIREPERSGLVPASGDAPRKVSYAMLAAQVRKHWRLYLTFQLGSTSNAALLYALLAWYPTFLTRVHGLSIGDAGLYTGLVYAVSGCMGCYLSPVAVRWLQVRGYVDAYIRFHLYITALAALPAIMAPLLNSGSLALGLLAPVIFLHLGVQGISMAFMNQITPNQLRAQVTAWTLLITYLIGMGVGAALTGALNQFVFSGPEGIRISLFLVALLTSILAISGFSRCLVHYQAWLENESPRELRR